jgi:4-carboxymuconolactone decarboxylase
LRFPELTRDQMTEAQKRVYDGIAAGPRGAVRGPFATLLRSPELAERVQKVGEYLRFNSSLPPRLNELAILINARSWESKYEWYAHRILSLKAGRTRKWSTTSARCFIASMLSTTRCSGERWRRWASRV